MSKAPLLASPPSPPREASPEGREGGGRSVVLTSDHPVTAYRGTFPIRSSGTLQFGPLRFWSRFLKGTKRDRWLRVGICGRRVRLDG